MMMEIELTITNEYGFFFNDVLKAMAMKRGGLIGEKWDMVICEISCPGGEEKSHADHEWVFITVQMFDGQDLHNITLHRHDIETQIDQLRLKAWENQEPAWPHPTVVKV